jgi:hypothetical protein
MYRELIDILTATYNQDSVKPLATYESGNNTYTVYAKKEINGSFGYPCLRTKLITTGQTRFDEGFLITAEDPKSGSAQLLTDLAAVSWG